jgi:hypothetical protein
MRIVVVGGGPAGLYFALLRKKTFTADEIVVMERNRPDDTFGFGVVFSDATLDNLETADAESLAGQRMNEVMKVLTIISTVFIPLSFIAGLYGMNFNPEVSAWNMPELNWVFGYPAALTVMALCAGAMLLFFARKGWFR